MTNTFKVGDSVKFRRDLILNERYGGLHYLENMEQFQRRIFKVIRTFSCNHFFLEGCSIEGQKLYISSEMLEPAIPSDLDPAWKFDRKGSL